MRRRTVASVAAAVIAAAVSAGAATLATAADPVAYGCDPQPRTEANCAGWHTGDVKLVWTLDINYDPEPGSDCSSPHIFDIETAGTKVTCTVSNGSTVFGRTVTIQIDKTPPAVSGFTADRPPDQDGWWNHPVALQFTATDALSGVAGCDVVNYAGPDGATASVAGSCRDVAGNSALGAFPIKYDATAPAIAALPSQTDVGHNTLNWTTSTDAVETRILRSPGTGAAALSQVYAGTDHTFSDGDVVGGRTYTYTLNAADAAGNVATAVVEVTAKPAPQPPPPAGAAKQGPPRLKWRRVKGADYYNVQLYRKGRKILSAWPHLNRLQLKRSWTFRGRQRLLTPGTYDWYVWPGYGRRARHRYGKLIAHRHLSITAAHAARGGR
jgi:hypothetical protein